jgi:KDO2-lipid IV(A) lauroyltransferase
LKRYVTAEGENYYNELIDSGRKFITVSAHIGSWDMLPVIASMFLGFKALIVGRESKSAALNRILENMRNVGDVVYVPQKGYIEKFAYYDKIGYLSGSILDHSSTCGDGVTAEFFGHRVSTLAGLLALCVRKGMPLLPCYLIRAGHSFRLIVHSPLYPTGEGRVREQIVNLASRLNKEYESIIREFPEQWYLLHRRFKRVEGPDGTMSNHIYRS